MNARTLTRLTGITAAYRQAFSGMPKGVWLLVGTLLVNRAGNMVIAFLPLYLTQFRHFSVTQAGWVISMFGVGALLGAYFGGFLSQRLGPIKAQAAVLTGNGIAFVAVPFLDSAPLITLAVSLCGFFSSAYRPAQAVSLTDNCPSPLLTRAFALNRLATNLGLAVAPVIGGVLAMINFDWLFFADGLTCFLAAVLILASSLRETSSPRQEKEQAEVTISGMPWQDAQFLILLSLSFLVLLVHFQFFSTLPLYWAGECSFSKRQIGYLLAINSGLIVAFEMLVVHGLEKKNQFRIAGGGALLIGVAFWMLPIAHSLLTAAVVILVVTLGEMLEAPAIAGIVARRAEGRQVGHYMGVQALAFSAALTVAPLAGTALYERSPTFLWQACAACCLLSALGLFLLSTNWKEHAVS